MWIEEKFSREYHVVCNGKTNRPSEKGLLSNHCANLESHGARPIVMNLPRGGGGGGGGGGGVPCLSCPGSDTDPFSFLSP